MAPLEALFNDEFRILFFWAINFLEDEASDKIFVFSLQRFYKSRFDTSSQTVMLRFRQPIFITNYQNSVTRPSKLTQLQSGALTPSILVMCIAFLILVAATVYLVYYLYFNPFYLRAFTDYLVCG
ncbi:uncharacterized protein LOC124893758 [Capsicum annuum]|uniref:uncharacterized protein LOC124893758 n=1 Tax=Capsicum annuum TaxID=4072 RepID=UPI001FB194A4|nr:uncharacterized protein LOC124893758 [Capsicum annuum]